jgi:hypothetical protein
MSSTGSKRVLYCSYSDSFPRGWFSFLSSPGFLLFIIIARWCWLAALAQLLALAALHAAGPQHTLSARSLARTHTVRSHNNKICHF